METDKNEETEKKKRMFLSFTVQSVWNRPQKCWKNPDFSSSAPKCGFIKGNEKIMVLLEKVKPEIVAFREAIITVSPRPGCRDPPTL